MSDRFGPLAGRLCGLAARQLGWRPPDFWRATPAELVAALAPPDPPSLLDRGELARLMERDDA